MWLTIDQIQALKAIQESGSITAASQSLNKAKSAVHYSMKKLEEQVGFPLIENSGYRSLLTRQAEDFLRASENLLKNYEILKEQAHQIATGVETKLAVSATALYPLKKLNSYIKKLQTRFPQTEVVFHREILSGHKFLQNGLVDIALFEHKQNVPGMEIKQVDEVIMHLVISKNHPLAKNKPVRITMEDLLDHPQVIQRATIPNDEVFGIHSKSRQWTVSDLDTKKQIILDGLGWGRLPEHDIASDLKSGRLVTMHKIAKPQTVPIILGRRQEDTHGRVSQCLWEMF